MSKVAMRFSTSKLQPGETTDLEVKADSGSLCAVSVVDKSVKLMGGAKNINQQIV